LYVDADILGSSSIFANAVMMRYNSANVISNTGIIANATLKSIKYSAVAITAKATIVSNGWKKTLIYRNASFTGRYFIVANSQNIKPSKQTLLFNLIFDKAIENVINFNRGTNVSTSFEFDINLWESD
jgi:hypothetical protein